MTSLKIPHLPDPLRRCFVTKDLGSVTTIAEETDPGQVGMTTAGVDRIWDGVESLYRSGMHPAITLCVRRGGEVVIDRAIGHARGNGPADGRDAEKVPATPETPFCVFSASKAITATLIHLLDERGLLHIGDPITEYLPELVGKEKITIGHVLAHRAGLARMPKASMDLDRLEDWRFQRELLAAAKPTHRPGKRQAYHAVSGGTILGEIVRSVTGKDVREVLAEEILDPLGFRWTNWGVKPEDLDAVGLAYSTGAPSIPPISTMLIRALGAAPDELVRLSNDPRFLTACLPSANTVTTANELSRFYELLLRGGELDGVRVMEARTLRRAMIAQSFLEVDLSLGAPVSFSYGFMLGGKHLSLYGPNTPNAFGHLGYVNVLGWADPDRDISVGLITSGKPILYPELTRLFDLVKRIGSAASA